MLIAGEYAVPLGHMVSSRSISVCAIFVSVAMFLGGCKETHDEYYQTIGYALRDSANLKGWIPSFIPNSARDIYIRYDVDTNEVWIACKISERDKSALKRGMEGNRIDSTEIRVATLGSAKWWPSDVGERREAYSYYKLDDWYMIISNERERIYVWRPIERLRL